MSEMTFTIRDENRAIWSRQDESFLDPLVAALSADPETIEELAAALTRFARSSEFQLTDGWRSGTCCEPGDAGIAIVDLPARLVAAQSTDPAPERAGEVSFRGADGEIGAWLRYHLSADWLLVRGIDSWEELSRLRRCERAAVTEVDAREVLYGQVAPFVAAECLAARGPVIAAAKETAAVPACGASAPADGDGPASGAGCRRPAGRSPRCPSAWSRAPRSRPTTRWRRSMPAG